MRRLFDRAADAVAVLRGRAEIERRHLRVFLEVEKDAFRSFSLVADVPVLSAEKYQHGWDGGGLVLPAPDGGRWRFVVLK